MAAYTKLLIESCLGIALCLGFTLAPARADSIAQNAKEQAGWFSAAHEVQIIDDRPMVKDFRSMPQQERTLELPSRLTDTVNGGTGTGCISSTIETIPRGGMHLGSQNLAYRAPRGIDKAVSSGAESGKSNGSVAKGRLLNPLDAPLNGTPRPPRGSLLRKNNQAKAM